MNRRRDERGAVAIVVGITMSLLVISSAFVLDLGLQRSARRDMQTLSDIVALDVARLLGRSADDILSPPATDPKFSLESVLANSVDRNRVSALGSVEDCPDDAGTCYDGVSAYLVDLDNEGNYTETDGVPDVVTGTAIPEAIVVIADSAVSFALGGLTGVTSGGVQRSAIATNSEPGLCFSVGTKTLTLNTDESALSPLLSGILGVNLGVIGYEGIVDLKEVSIPIADLLIELNVGSVSQLATTNVTLDEFFLAAANVLEQNGDTASASILESVTLGIAGDLEFALGSILTLGADGTAGLTADVNVLSIIGAGIVAANGENALTGTIPNVASVKIIEPPQIACGRNGATARSAQIRTAIDMTLPLNSLLGLASGSTVKLDINVGAATARINGDLGCLPDTVPMTVQTGAVVIEQPAAPTYGAITLKVTLAKFLDSIPGLGLILRGTLLLLGIDPITLEAKLSGGVASKAETRTITFPDPPALPPTVVFPEDGLDSVLTLSGTGLRLSPTGNGAVGSLLGVLLNPALGVLTTGVLDPVVNSLNPVLTAALNPILDSLGLGLGVADVTMLGRPVCDGSKLVG